LSVFRSGIIVSDRRRKMKIFNVSEFKPSMADHWIAWSAVTNVWPDDGRVTGSGFVIETYGSADICTSLLFPTKEERDEVLQKFLERWRAA
jgi:hypothetical protein